MFVVVHHRITDTNKFWSGAEKFLESVPAGLKLHSSLPSADGTRATCLWECSALPKLRDVMEKYSAGLARNEYIVADEAKAMGLPKKTIQEEQTAPQARA